MTPLEPIVLPGDPMTVNPYQSPAEIEDEDKSLHGDRQLLFMLIIGTAMDVGMVTGLVWLCNDVLTRPIDWMDIALIVELSVLSPIMTGTLILMGLLYAKLTRCQHVDE